MNIIIIADQKEEPSLNLEKYKLKYPNTEFFLSDKIIDSNKEDLIIFMKVCDFSKMKGRKTLFLEKEIKTKDSFFIKSFASKSINEYKIDLLIDIFLD